MRNVKVATELARQQGKVFERLELSAAVTLEELRRVMLFDPAAIYEEDGSMRPIRDLPPEVRSCIASVEVKELFVPGPEKDSPQVVVGRITKVKFWNKMAAIAKAMEHFNLAGGSLGALSLPPSAEQVARQAETKAQLEALLKAKEGRWHGSNVVPISPPKKIG